MPKSLQQRFQTVQKQTSVAISLLSMLGVLCFLLPSAQCLLSGMLFGILPVILLMVVQLVLFQIVVARFSMWALTNTLLLIAAFLLIVCLLNFGTAWQMGVCVLLLIGSWIGIFYYRFTTILFFLFCIAAGALLMG